jgi:hypothetical protein
VVRERDFRLVADRLTDLSLTGMRVTPADPVLTGERLIVSFRWPGTDVFIDAEAVVARVVHGRRPGEVTRSLGLEFEHMDGRLRAFLAEALSCAPLAPPGWRPGRRHFDQALRAYLSN